MEEIQKQFGIAVSVTGEARSDAVIDIMGLSFEKALSALDQKLPADWSTGIFTIVARWAPREEPEGN